MRTKLASSLLVAAVPSGCATMSPLEKASYAGVMLDAGSTYYGEQRGLREGNPAYGGGKAAVKVAMLGVGINLCLHRWLDGAWPWRESTGTGMPELEQKRAWGFNLTLRVLAAWWNVKQIQDHKSPTPGAPE
jgi:hypothetical protein